MKQSDLDMFEIRGLMAITRILAERVNEGTPFTAQTVQGMRVYVNTLQKVLEGMQCNQGGNVDPLSDVERMDKWFITGFTNLLEYLDKRLLQGPPMCERYRSDLFTMMQRMATNVAISPPRDSPTPEVQNESGAA